jgi:hypothetical protein
MEQAHGSYRQLLSYGLSCPDSQDDASKSGQPVLPKGATSTWASSGWEKYGDEAKQSLFVQVRLSMPVKGSTGLREPNKLWREAEKCFQSR